MFLVPWSASRTFVPGTKLLQPSGTGLVDGASGASVRVGVSARVQYHAIRADLLRRLGRTAHAALAYEAAIARTDNAAERVFLRSRQVLTRAE
jgi:hypothetical protein